MFVVNFLGGVNIFEQLQEEDWWQLLWWWLERICQEHSECWTSTWHLHVRAVTAMSVTALLQYVISRLAELCSEWLSCST